MRWVHDKYHAYRKEVYRNMVDEPVQGPVVPTQPVAQPVMAPAPEPVVVAPVAAPQPVAQPQPEMRDRTREQFEKLLENNRQLAQQNALYRQQIQGAQPIAPRQQNPSDFVDIDPTTGDKYINEDRLRSRLEEVTSKATQLEQALQAMQKSSQAQEVERQEREAYSSYPELNPSGKAFDTRFNREVRSALTDSFYNPEDYGGRPLSFREAADFVKAQSPKSQPAPVQPTPEEVAAQQQQQQAVQAAKEQGGVSVQSQPGPQARQSLTDQEELDSLRIKTRYFDDTNALAQRIKHTEHILPKEE